jgi:hypothetical protein
LYDAANDASDVDAVAGVLTKCTSLLAANGGVVPSQSATDTAMESSRWCACSCDIHLCSQHSACTNLTINMQLFTLLERLARLPKSAATLQKKAARKAAFRATKAAKRAAAIAAGGD